MGPVSGHLRQPLPVDSGYASPPVGFTCDSSQLWSPAMSRRIGIIGAGPGGICMGIKLLEAGIDDFTIFERAPGVGGVWFHNTYPGAACDVPSALYSFSFALKRDWSRPYATQPEIRAYF